MNAPLAALASVVFVSSAAAAQGEPASPPAVDPVVAVDEHQRFVSPDGATAMTLMVNPESLPGSNAAVSLIAAEPGAAVPEHRHEVSSEILYVVAGSGHMTVAGQRYPVQSGDAIYIAPGILHAYDNDGQETLQAIQIYSPPGPEARFRQWTPGSAGGDD